MCEIYDKWPEIAKNSYEQDFKEVSYDKIDHIVFAGMGGSGAIGDILASILSKNNIHVRVVKGYLLPKTVDSNTLVVTTSVSGNTTETLNILKYAKETKCKIIAFSSGGKMADFCVKHKIEHRDIPMYHSPRSSFTSYLYSMLKVLHPVLSIKNKDVKESINFLEQTKNKINSCNLTKSNESLSLAEWISGIPIIYYPFGLKGAAIRFKNSLQENAKSQAMAEDILEASHNGIVSWEVKSNVQPILIEGTEDYIKTKERWEIIKQFFSEKNIPYREIKTLDGNILSKLINLIYVLDYTSIYKAILSQIDPSPVKAIDFVKKKLDS